ncbi:MAG: hypothetical protein Q9209_001238 [Squamulea sp. 1 TL-2023]
MDINQPFQLLDLPLELRTLILSFLLPNVPIIACSVQNSPNTDSPPRNCSPYAWETFQQPSDYNYRRHDEDDPYSPQILRVNRQLHDEATSYLYHQKTFVLSIYNFGYDFLKESNQLENLPLLPYSEIKEFIIEVGPHTLPTQGTRLHWNLLKLCGLIHQRGIHFKKLRVGFTDQVSGRREFDAEAEWHLPFPKNIPLWEHIDLPPAKPIPLWEYTNDEPQNIPPELTPDDYRERNFEYTAWKAGFSSTFTYLASPLRMLSSVAEQAIIDLPRSCENKPHYKMLKQWYEEGLDGRYPFDEDDGVLKDYRWWFEHPYGPKEGCEDKCEECVAYAFEKEKGRKVWGDLLRLREWELEESYWRYIELKGSVSTEDMEVWEVWENVDPCSLTFWQRVRKGCMQWLEVWMGKEGGREVYRWICPWGMVGKVQGFLEDVLECIE